MTVAPPQTTFWNVINIETRRIMGVATAELAEYTPPPDAKARLRKWAQSVLSQADYLMSDDEAAARVAADIERVRELQGEPATGAEDFWSSPSWRQAAIDYHQDRGGRVSLLDQEPRR